MNFDEKNTQSYDWDKDGVYVIEPTDYVEGGQDGVSNRQAKALTKRTRNIHDRLTAHNNDNVRHITAAERTNWNAKETPTGAQTKATTAKNEAIATSASDASTKSAAALQSAKEYANGKDSTLRNDMAVADTATLRSAKSYADTIVAALVDNSPEALNTLQELAVAMGNDPNFATTVMQAIGERAKTTDVNAALAAALQSAKTYTNTEIAKVNTTLATHNNDNVRHITAGERTAWNAKETPTGAQTKATTAKNEAITASASDASTKSAAALQSAKEYANGKDSTLRTDMAVADTATLRSAKSYADTIVAALVDNSPEALNTLQELAKAMGNDPNFATTVMQAIGERAKTTDVNAALARKLDVTSSFAKDSIKVGDLGSRYGYLRNEYITFNTAKMVLGATYGSDVPKDAFSIFNGVTSFLHNPDVNGQAIYHTGNFNPADKADKAGSFKQPFRVELLSMREDGSAGVGYGKSQSGAMNNKEIVLYNLAEDGQLTLWSASDPCWLQTGTSIRRRLYHAGNLVAATPSANGLMSSADKSKLDGVATNANNYTHPNTASTRHVTDTEKTTWNAKASTAIATPSANGLMSAGDKSKLDGLDGKPKVYGYIAANGAFTGTTKGVTKVELQGYGVYRVFHGLGHTSYMVQLTSQNEGLPRVNLSVSIRPIYFEVRCCDQTASNSVLVNIDFSFVVFEY